MRYQIWDSTSYDADSLLTPFTKLYESEKLNDIRNYLDEYNGEVVLFISNKDEILFDTREKVYERDGETIYKRNKITLKRKKI